MLGIASRVCRDSAIGQPARSTAQPPVGAPLGLGSRLDGRRDMLRLVIVVDCRAVSRQLDRRLVRGLVASILGRRLVRVATLPAGAPLGELFLELARVEQDEGGQLDRPAGRPDRTTEALVDDVRDETDSGRGGHG